MIESLFKHIEPFIENGKIKNLNKLLSQAGVSHVFQEIYSDYGVDADKISTYLLMVYCADSTYVISGQDFLDTKISILEIVGLNPNDHYDLIRFRKQSVRDVINFLCNDWRRKQVVIWKESVMILDEIATTRPAIDAKSPAKNISDAAKFAYDIKLKIAALEKEIMQQSKSPERLKEADAISLENASYEKLVKQVYDSK